MEAKVRDPNSAEAIAAAFGSGQQEQMLPALRGVDTGAPMEMVTARAVEVARAIPRVLQRIAALAAAAGDDWYYSFPVQNRREGRTDTVEGPSIKCALNVAREFGNCHVDTRVIDAPDHWIIYARFVDLETGFSLTRPFQQRKDQQTMGKAGRAADIAFQIGVSKAIRNVIVNALETYTQFAFDRAKQGLVESVGKDLARYKARVIDRFGELRVPLVNVERIVGKPAAQWLAGDVARLIAELRSVADGMANADDLWPAPGEMGAPPVPNAEQHAEQTRKPRTKAKAPEAAPPPPPPPAAPAADQKPAAETATAAPTAQAQQPAQTQAPDPAAPATAQPAAEQPADQAEGDERAWETYNEVGDTLGWLDPVEALRWFNERVGKLRGDELASLLANNREVVQALARHVGDVGEALQAIAAYQSTLPTRDQPAAEPAVPPAHAVPDANGKPHWARYSVEMQDMIGKLESRMACALFATANMPTIEGAPPGIKNTLKLALERRAANLPA